MTTNWQFDSISNTLNSPNIHMQQTCSSPHPSHSPDRNIPSDGRSRCSKSSRKRAKSYICNECPSTGLKSFATPNDLERHVRSVHGSLRDGDRIWKCPVPGCSSAGKVWPRFDNCKAHILRHGKQYESQIPFSESTYDSKVDQLPLPKKSRHASSPSVASRSRLVHNIETSSEYQGNGSWRDLSPTIHSDHSANNALVHHNMTNIDPNLLFDSSGFSHNNALAEVGNFDEHTVAWYAMNGPPPLITLQEAENTVYPGRLVLAPSFNSQEWIKAKKMLQKTSDSNKCNAASSSMSMKEDLTLTKAMTCDDHNAHLGESPRTLLSFQSAGERSFIGYNTIEVDEQSEILDEDELYVAHLLAQFVLEQYLKLKQTKSLPMVNTLGHTNNSSENHQNYTSQPRSSGLESSSRKRPQQDDSDSDSGNDNDDGDGSGRGGGKRGPPSPGPRSKRPKTEHHRQRSFACPYHKADPHRYSSMNATEREYRNCGTCLLHSISALRQHLYRVHKRPDHYCSLCFNIFTSPELRDDHMREPNNQCQRRDNPFTEKMSHHAFQSVKSLRLPKSKDEHEKEKYARNAWDQIFKACFPGVQPPDSPYADANEQLAIWNYVEMFRVLGQPMAEHLCENVNNSVSGRSLPRMTQAMFDEAYNFFSHELAQSGESLAEGVPAHWEAQMSFLDSVPGQRSNFLAPPTFPVPQAAGIVPKSSQTYTDSGIDVNSIDDGQNIAWSQPAPQAASRPLLVVNPNFQQNQEPVVAQSPYTPVSSDQNWGQPIYSGPWHGLPRG